MIAIMIVITVFFVIKMVMDYVTLRAGVTTIAPVRGFLIGFDMEEVIEGWENQETKEVEQIRHISFEIALGFVGLIFTWQEDLEDDEEIDEENYTG